MHRILLLLIAVMWSPMVSAQSSVPSASTDPSMSLCSGLLTESGVGMTGKDKLCSCLISQVTSQLTADEMTAYAQANMNSQSPPQTVMDKVMGIATRCLSQSR
jgi:hypothetical protein